VASLAMRQNTTAAAMGSGPEGSSMCGRTALTASPEELRVAFGLDEAPRIAPHYNVPPSQPLYVIRAATSTGGAAGRKLEALRWGLVPWWATGCPWC
jgi:putative SOS response-associated peptidase YedK